MPLMQVAHGRDEGDAGLPRKALAEFSYRGKGVHFSAKLLRAAISLGRNYYPVISRTGNKIFPNLTIASTFALITSEK